ncbi:MAG: polysaccharide deacetylase family protein [Burkholderiales bacterium]|jgi:peptidoglycan/xylan/chitin deacetylase (PgdA/CDA1 family)|nr:polysaccharide deacetylase family protein [Burkholderiales bacterium]
MSRLLGAALLLVVGALSASAAHAQVCRGQVYLTLDTGSMRHAEEIAAILRKHDVKATFFLANEKTPRGDHALDPAWDGYWKARAEEGHAFGSHTWRHGRFLSDAAGGAVRYRPQFGAQASQTLMLAPQAVCEELRSVESAFRRATGGALDPVWRAPGGRTTTNALAAAQQCGFAHVHWAEAGFLGDELSSDTYSNAHLLQAALRNVRDGDVLMAHLGIWSRHEPFAPMLDPLIAGLKQRGLCFRTLRDHPQFPQAGHSVPVALAAAAAASPASTRKPR